MIRRPVLAPGLRALRHPTGDLQLGLSAEHRFRVPDAPGVRRALSILDRGETLPDTAEIRRARALLAPALRDGDALHRPGMSPGEVAAVTLRHPLSGSDRLDARRRARIRVVGDLGHGFAPLLTAVGLTTTETATPTAVLVISQGEPGREPFDDLVAAGTAHLVIRAVEAAVLVGPFVIPGLTPCLRCWDLHQGTAEPAYIQLLHDTVHSDRHDGVAEPVPASLSWIALGWAVEDLVRYVEGDRPTTASAVVPLRADSASFTPEPVSVHPDCSCRWTAGG